MRPLNRKQKKKKETTVKFKKEERKTTANVAEVTQRVKQTGREWRHNRTTEIVDVMKTSGNDWR